MGHQYALFIFLLFKFRPITRHVRRLEILLSLILRLFKDKLILCDSRYGYYENKEEKSSLRLIHSN